MAIKKFTAAPTAALALGLLLSPPVFLAIDAIINTAAPLVSAAIGNLSFMSPAMGEPAALTNKQSDALDTYNNALKNFESILGQRRAQINSNQRLPDDALNIVARGEAKEDQAAAA
jgi:hypothetical protein